MPQKKSLFCQPPCSSLTSREWVWNAQLCGNHRKQMPEMTAGKTDGACLSGPLGRECDRFYLPSKGRTAGLPSVCENKSGATRNEKWSWQDKELHFPDSMDTKPGLLTLQESSLTRADGDMNPESFRRSTGQWWELLPIFIPATHSPVSSTHNWTTAFQQVKITSKAQVLSGRQSMNNHSSTGSTFSSPTKTTNMSWEGVPIGTSLKIHFSLLQIRNSVQLFADLSDDGKEIFAAKMILRAPIHSPQTSLS